VGIPISPLELDNSLNVYSETGVPIAVTFWSSYFTTKCIYGFCM